MPLSPQIVITPEDIVYKSFSITAVSYTSTTATYTATGHTFALNNVVQITGLAPDGYNGTYTITSVATNTFTVANTTNTALTDQTGNAYWADSTEYNYEGGQTVAFAVDNLDLLNPDLNQAYAAANLANTNATTAIALAGTKNTVFYSGTAPTANANGDLWIDTANGNKLYQWNGSAWVSVQDTAIAAAASAATAAQTTADGKNKVYRQGTTPTGTFAIGDIWFNTASDNAISRWDGTTWVATTLGNNALASISANKITAGTIDASVITVSNINAGNISTGYLASARIAAGTITGSQLVAGTITASQIATGTITATQIAAGTITATQISSSYVYAGSITAAQITANSGTFTGPISAASGNIGGFNIVSSSYLQYGTTYIWGNYSASYCLQDTSRGIYVNDILTSGTGSSGYGVATGSLYATGASRIDGTMNFFGNVHVNNAYLYVDYAATAGTTAATNAYISSTGQILKTSTTSSLRYKENIVDISLVPELDPKLLLQIPVKAFTYKEGHIPDSDDRAGQMLPGLIAEDVDSIYPIAADYADGNVETWNERFIVPGLLALVQDLTKRIEVLEGKI